MPQDCRFSLIARKSSAINDDSGMWNIAASVETMFGKCLPATIKQVWQSLLSDLNGVIGTKGGNNLLCLTTSWTKALKYGKPEWNVVPDNMSRRKTNWNVAF